MAQLFAKSTPIDLGDPSTWGTGTIEIVKSIAEHDLPQDWLEYPEDSLIGDEFAEIEQQIRAVLAGRAMLAYHASRLLPHESHDISSGSGLRALTDDLRKLKVKQAVANYPHLASDDFAAESNLLASGPLTWQRGAVRLGFLNFVAPLAIFDTSAGGFHNLLDTWGGEAVGWISGAGADAEILLHNLTAMSTPSIVEFLVAVPTLPSGRDLLSVMAPAAFGATSRGDQWASTTSVPAHDVRAIITPSSDRWPASLDEYCTF